MLGAALLAAGLRRYFLRTLGRIGQQVAARGVTIVDDGTLFGMAAVTQRGRTADGEWYTCYSIVMRPAPAHLAELHDRMPLLVPASLSHDWLTAPASREIIDEAIIASDEMADRVSARPRD